MSVVCRCERPWPDGEKACVKCGRPLQAERPLRRGPQADEAERKLVFAKALRAATEAPES